MNTMNNWNETIWEYRNQLNWMIAMMKIPIADGNRYTPVPELPMLLNLALTLTLKLCCGREEKERVQVSSSGMLWASALVTTLAGLNSSWTDANANANKHKLNIQTTANELNNWTTKELNDANGNSPGPTSRLSCSPPTDTCQRVPQRRERSQSKAWLWPWCQTAQPQFPCFILLAMMRGKKPESFSCCTSAPPNAITWNSDIHFCRRATHRVYNWRKQFEIEHLCTISLHNCYIILKRKKILPDNNFFLILHILYYFILYVEFWADW